LPCHSCNLMCWGCRAWGGGWTPPPPRPCSGRNCCLIHSSVWLQNQCRDNCCGFCGC
jgi:hypothetical protein